MGPGGGGGKGTAYCFMRCSKAITCLKILVTFRASKKVVHIKIHAVISPARLNGINSLFHRNSQERT